MSNPIIVINVNMGSKGHQIGRLIASCSNVLWYDHTDNGTNPWDPCSGILNSELSGFHFDRRFADSTTIPPVLDYARRSGLPERPELSFDRCNDGQFFIYVTHSDLDESRNYFKGQHLVVLDKDIERFMNTSWNFRVGKTKTLISELYTTDEVETMLINTFDNYETNVKSNDVVIDTIADLLDIDNFKLLCERLSLEFNEDGYNKVRTFLRK
jgi:hypothetical protein